MLMEPKSVVDKSTEVLAPNGIENHPSKCMIIWEFYEAPEFVRAHSTHGGDEDGVLWIPNGVEAPWWVEKLWMSYGPDADFVQFKDGMLVIWAHA